MTMNTRSTTFAFLLCAAGMVTGCLPIPLLPSSEIHGTENDIDELLDNNASRSDVINSLGVPTRQHESAISYLVCRKAAGIGYIMCLPYQCTGGDFRGTDCFELILEFDGNYRLASYEKLHFEGVFQTPAGSMWETTYPKILREKANNGDIEFEPQKPFVGLLNDFVQSIIEDRKPAADAIEGAKNVRLLLESISA